MGKRVYVYAVKSLVAWNCREHVIIKVTKKYEARLKRGRAKKGEREKKGRKKERKIDSWTVAPWM